jgi:hypothetical protein
MDEASHISATLSMIFAGFIVIVLIRQASPVFWATRSTGRSTVTLVGQTFNPEAIITLVHGTWARGAGWTEPKSRLCLALSEIYSGRVGFYRHMWSGRNSLRARDSAAKELQAALNELVDRYPSSKHFIICHSHGGNVVLQSLTDKISETISGIVFFAVPFFHIRRRANSTFLTYAWLMFASLYPFNIHRGPPD